MVLPPVRELVTVSVICDSINCGSRQNASVLRQAITVLGASYQLTSMLKKLLSQAIAGFKNFF